MDRTEYLERRKSLASYAKASSVQFDTTLITLSSGLLIFGATYLRNIDIDYSNSSLLLWGLIITSLNIFFILISFFIGEEVHRDGLDRLDKKYTLSHLKESEKDKISKYKKKIKEFDRTINIKNKILTRTKGINILLLIIGAGIMACFIYLNIKTGLKVN